MGNETEVASTPGLSTCSARATAPISPRRNVVVHPAPATRRFTGPIVAATLILAGLALYILRVDDVAGLIGDDAWYVVLAKGIAQGAGPYVISSAGTQFLSQVYPPGFPAFCLSCC